MRKKVVATGAAVLVGISLAACGHEDAESAPPDAVINNAPAPNPTEKMTAVCYIEKIGSIVLKPSEQARLVHGDDAERRKVKTALRKDVAPHILDLAVHSTEDLKQNSYNNKAVVGAIVHLVAPKVPGLAEHADYTVTGLPDMVKEGYVEVTSSTERCVRIPETPLEHQPDAEQSVSPLA